MTINKRKKIAVILTLFLLMSTSLSISESSLLSTNDITTDDIDGFWQINHFSSEDLEENNWQVDENLTIQNGKLTIKQTTTSEGIVYDLKKTDQSFTILIFTVSSKSYFPLSIDYYLLLILI